MHAAPSQQHSGRESGYTVLEVIIAIFIFGCISLSILHLIRQTDRLRGRALYRENATRIAADESERLRNIASSMTPLFEDSSYTEEIAGRTYTVQRTVIAESESPSYMPSALEPEHIEVRIADANNTALEPLVFNLLIGSDHP